MYFSQSHQGQASKATKIAVVAALHLAVASVLVHNMSTRDIPRSAPPDEWTVLPDTLPKTQPEPEPLKHEIQPQKLPTIVIPEPQVNIQQQPDPVIRGDYQTKDTPPPMPYTGGGGTEAPVKPAVTQPPAMRSAVLANAKDCVTPDYPARAARNGETGTVTLALLVGTNGSVINSRILTSSGSRELDRAAQSALSMCAFKPAMEGGVAQEGWAKISYVWTLD